MTPADEARIARVVERVVDEKLSVLLAEIVLAFRHEVASHLLGHHAQVDVKTAAEILGATAKTVRKRARAGKIPGATKGPLGVWRFDPEALQIDAPDGSAPDRIRTTNLGETEKTTPPGADPSGAPRDDDGGSQ